MSRPAGDYLTPQEAAALFHTSVSFIYKLASVHEWKRVRHSGKIYYDLIEVAERLSK